MAAGIIYLIIGAISTMWIEQMLIDQGYENELGLAFDFGERLKSIILWPVFTLPYLFRFTVVFVKSIVRG